jgi:hypothetical protein
MKYYMIITFNLHNLNEADDSQSPIDHAKETKSGASPTLNSNRKRGTLLALWLVLLILANAYGTIRNIFDIFSNSSVLLSVPLWASYALTVGSVLIVLSAIAMLEWRKWGFYLYCAVAVLGFAVNLTVGAGVFAFVGLVGIAITYLIIRSKWAFFK